jgi:IS5 family transposase
LWESVLPKEALVMPDELAKVNDLLDDPVFFEPFRPFFHPTAGRRSIPMETFLRLMYLKYRYGLGYERLCRVCTAKPRTPRPLRRRAMTRTACWRA